MNKGNLISKLTLSLMACSLTFLPLQIQAAHSLLGKDKSAKVKVAKAELKPTKGSTVKGLVTFTAVDGGVKIVADIEGLVPGDHGFHIHEFGDCSAPDASSAGGHFNPTKKDHGAPDVEDRHAGDLGNITADANGKAHYERTDSVIQLNGPESIVGHSVVVHADKDDYKTQPTGASGARTACGVIKAVD